MGKTISIKVLFGIYLLLMAGKVFAFSCNVDGGSSIGVVKPLFMLISTLSYDRAESGCRLVSAYKLLE